MGLQQEGGMQQYHQRVVYNLQNIGSQGKKIMIVQSLNIEQLSFSNLLCAWATQAITTHAPIGEY